MDNPCKHCDKANMDFVNDCGYGCDNPCEQAKNFWEQAGNKLDVLLDKFLIILRKEDEGK